MVEPFLQRHHRNHCTCCKHPANKTRIGMPGCRTTSLFGRIGTRIGGRCGASRCRGIRRHRSRTCLRRSGQRCKVVASMPRRGWASGRRTVHAIEGGQELGLGGLVNVCLRVDVRVYFRLRFLEEGAVVPATTTRLHGREVFLVDAVHLRGELREVCGSGVGPAEA